MESGGRGRQLCGVGALEETEPASQAALLGGSSPLGMTRPLAGSCKWSLESWLLGLGVSPEDLPPSKICLKLQALASAVPSSSAIPVPVVAR